MPQPIPSVEVIPSVAQGVHESSQVRGERLISECVRFVSETGDSQFPVLLRDALKFSANHSDLIESGLSEHESFVSQSVEVLTENVRVSYEVALSLHRSELTSVCPPPATPAAADSLAAPATARQGAGTTMFLEFESWLMSRHDRLNASSKQLLARMEAKEQPILPVYDEFELVYRQMGELIGVRALLAAFKRGEAA